MNVLLGPIIYVMPELDAYYTFTRLLRDLCPLYFQSNFEGVYYGLDVRAPRTPPTGMAAGHRLLTHSRTLSSAWARVPFSFFLCQLMDECLQIVDPTLFRFLDSKQLSAKVYAFRGTRPRRVASDVQRRAHPEACGRALFHLAPLGGAAVLTLCACTPPLEEVLKLWDFLFAFGVHLAVLCYIAQMLAVRNVLLRSSQYVGACARGEGALGRLTRARSARGPGGRPASVQAHARAAAPAAVGREDGHSRLHAAGASPPTRAVQPSRTAPVGPARVPVQRRDRPVTGPPCAGLTGCRGARLYRQTPTDLPERTPTTPADVRGRGRA